jgi:hypothetical protein
MMQWAMIAHHKRRYLQTVASAMISATAKQAKTMM